jgi:putative SOS response-associated peptidase YedK
MPAILPESIWDKWLSPDNSDSIRLKERLMEEDLGQMEWYPVSKEVNSARNEGPELINQI